ncbi:MerR family transcriptional regulator, partial [Streptomyces sp. NPDC127106]|uniref:MerR family transcriptional regulator n=1 Tax=Streptomyces sp. NPDC127106 TaxID=3345360 RepID=UPI00362B7179
MTGGVTIGQAAAFAGVTVKTVRHYHQHGLIDEPRRDASGYRRYGSADLLRLIQVRTLAAAGVPLAEVGPRGGAPPPPAGAPPPPRRRSTPPPDDTPTRAPARATR